MEKGSSTVGSHNIPHWLRKVAGWWYITSTPTAVSNLSPPGFTRLLVRKGSGVFYLFDCLSELLDAWATDGMIGNFFTVTCPYLFELDTVAYFALLRDHHSFKTIARIRSTTQLLIDLYNHDGALYLHPLKVWERFSPTMFLPHLRQDNNFLPISSSFDATGLFTNLPRAGLEGPGGAPGLLAPPVHERGRSGGTPLFGRAAGDGGPALPRTDLPRVTHAGVGP